MSKPKWDRRSIPWRGTGRRPEGTAGDTRLQGRPLPTWSFAPRSKIKTFNPVSLSYLGPLTGVGDEGTSCLFRKKGLQMGDPGEVREPGSLRDTEASSAHTPHQPPASADMSTRVSAVSSFHRGDTETLAQSTLQ